MCVCVEGGVARQYKGVKKTRNYSKWGQYKVASGDLVPTSPGTAAQKGHRQGGHDHTGRDAPSSCPRWAPVYCHVGPGWLDQQRRRYPKHGDMLSLGGLLTPRLTTNPGGRGLGITVNGDSIRLLVVMSFTPVSLKGHRQGGHDPSGRDAPSSCPRWAPVYWHGSLKGH